MHNLHFMSSRVRPLTSINRRLQLDKTRQDSTGRRQNFVVDVLLWNEMTHALNVTWYVLGVTWRQWRQTLVSSVDCRRSVGLHDCRRTSRDGDALDWRDSPTDAGSHRRHQRHTSRHASYVTSCVTWWRDAEWRRQSSTGVEYGGAASSSSESRWRHGARLFSDGRRLRLAWAAPRRVRPGEQLTPRWVGPGEQLSTLSGRTCSLHRRGVVFRRHRPRADEMTMTRSQRLRDTPHHHHHHHHRLLGHEFSSRHVRWTDPLGRYKRCENQAVLKDHLTALTSNVTRLQLTIYAPILVSIESSYTAS